MIHNLGITPEPKYQLKHHFLTHPWHDTVWKTYNDERQPAAVQASDLCKLLQAKGSLPKSAHLAIESEPQREQRQSGLGSAAQQVPFTAARIKARRTGQDKNKQRGILSSVTSAISVTVYESLTCLLLFLFIFYSAFCLVSCSFSLCLSYCLCLSHTGVSLTCLLLLLSAVMTLFMCVISQLSCCKHLWTWVFEFWNAFYEHAEGMYGCVYLWEDLEHLPDGRLGLVQPSFTCLNRRRHFEAEPTSCQSLTASKQTSTLSKPALVSYPTHWLH